ncbi:unnamed protein product [Aureobasidium vineae]|uniref:Bromo domain-containing protein n=1 Tax=Aureobasidium vineae TaxID=2773715 RepID=A0A9N8JC95_9PEZI|nr:unnamed protein product [Aureobasidium vineae]
MAPHQNTTKMEHADFLFCEHVLEEFKRFKHRKYVATFKEPVDIVAVPTYLNVIRQPMDLSTIAFKMGKNVYDSAASFKADFELMFDNCDRFNAGHLPSAVFEHGRRFREEFNRVWLDQQNWLKRVHPEVSIEAQSEEQDENMDEPPAKKRRQSSRLVASNEPSPTLQLPYTAASVVKPASSAPTTPVPGRPKRGASRTSTTNASTSRADSVSSTVKQTITTKAVVPQPAESPLTEPTETEITALQTTEHNVALAQDTSPIVSDAPQSPENTPKSHWEEFQERLRDMVTKEATRLLNNPNIKHQGPGEDPNKLANTMWEALAMDINHGSKGLEGKASFSAWVELAVEELSKVAIRDVGNQVKSEIKKALIVVMEGHYQFLRNKLDGFHEELRARFEA